MATVTMKSSGVTYFTGSIYKMSARVKRLVKRFNAQPDMTEYQDWYQAIPAGGRIPFRVWSRHSAYLDMVRDMHQHNDTHVR